MKDFLQKHTTSIIVAIVSTMIFLYLLQPILEYVGKLVIYFGTYLGAAYVNEIFTQIAYLELRDHSFLLLAIIYGALGGTSMMAAIFLWRPPDKSRRSNDIIQKLNASIKAKLIASALLVNITLMTIAVISTQVYQLTLITSFKQHIRILAPYMTEQQEEELLSSWSLLKSADDYDLVNKSMQKIASDNNIKLPENSLYSLTSI